jgi:hypothetical protein
MFVCWFCRSDFAALKHRIEPVRCRPLQKLFSNAKFVAKFKNRNVAKFEAIQLPKNEFIKEQKSFVNHLCTVLHMIGNLQVLNNSRSL